MSLPSARRVSNFPKSIRQEGSQTLRLLFCSPFIFAECFWPSINTFELSTTITHFGIAIHPHLWFVNLFDNRAGRDQRADEAALLSAREYNEKSKFPSLRDRKSTRLN